MKSYRYILILIVLCLTVIGCNPDQSKSLNTDELSFDTTDASELFFKNVRLPYYEVEENTEAGLRVYHLKDDLENRTEDYFGYAIVHSWKTDRAYLSIEQGGVLENVEKMNFIFRLSGETGNVDYERGNAIEQARLSAKIYNTLSKGGDVSISFNDKKIGLWESAEQKEATRIILYDFFNLTENF